MDKDYGEKLAGKLEAGQGCSFDFELERIAFQDFVTSNMDIRDQIAIAQQIKEANAKHRKANPAIAELQIETSYESSNIDPGSNHGMVRIYTRSKENPQFRDLLYGAEHSNRDRTTRYSCTDLATKDKKPTNLNWTFTWY